MIAGASVAFVTISAGAGVAQAGVSGTTGVPASSRPIVVSTLSDSGSGSLRAAIQSANAGSSSGSAAVITFSVHGIIKLASALPAISSDTTINGTSAPTYVGGGAPVVEINCNGNAGLRFAGGSAGSQLLAVAVDNSGGDGVTLNAGQITLNNDYVGLNLAGTAFGNRGTGVYVSATSSGNKIGLNASGASGAVANVISGNRRNGLSLSGSHGNTVVANRIGTNSAGTSAIANAGNGILITRGASSNEIGGTKFVDSATGKTNNPTGSKGTVTPVFVVPPLGNLVSGNRKNGVLIDGGSRSNALNGNFVGTTADGDAAIGNADDGVRISGASNNSLTGCKFVNNPFVYYNVLSGNGQNGLRITSSDNIVVQGNFFGTGANNSSIVANRLDGIRDSGSSKNTQVGGVIPLGNVSAGNGQNGIQVTGRVSGFVTFNTFGGLLAFNGAAPNGRDGLLITSTGGNNLARTNVLSGNRKNGIEIGGNASGVTVDPDIVGLNTRGNGPLANGGDGLLIDGSAHRNLIGGSRRSVIRQDTFSANKGYGVVITGKAHDNRVFTSFIGTNLAGLKRMANGKGGVLLAGKAFGNFVGLASARPPSNLISGNTGNGVTLRSGTRRNRVLRNFIGLDRLRRSLPNSGSAVVNQGRLNIIRGNKARPRG